jgi:hypothetical protein
LQDAAMIDAETVERAAYAICLESYRRNANPLDLTWVGMDGRQRDFFRFVMDDIHRERWFERRAYYLPLAKACLEAAGLELSADAAAGCPGWLPPDWLD